MHWLWGTHYSNVIMSGMASQITGIWTVRLAVCSGAHRRKYQSSASLAFARGIHRWPVDSPHKGPVTWNTFSFDDVIMNASQPMHWLWDSDHIFATSCFANLVWKIIEEYSIKISIAARADTPTTESVYLKHTPTLVSLGTGGISENICSQIACAEARLMISSFVSDLALYANLPKPSDVPVLICNNHADLTVIIVMIRLLSIQRGSW